ncbi:MAG TPA: helix-turn-helix domain-containing protein [Patescibacteria group bacterium]
MKDYNNFNFLTPKQVSEVLQLNILTIYSYIKHGQLTAVKLGKAYRIRKEDFEIFLKYHKTTTKLKDF